MYTVKRIGLLNLPSLWQVLRIIRSCGKDMAEKQGLHHWDNSVIKTAAILGMCLMKNSIYLVRDDKNAVATFQIRKIDDTLHFEKLAVSPTASGKGIGTFCLERMEKLGAEMGCTKIGMDVYSLSNRTIEFYLNRGYVSVGETKTLKYCEIRMEKWIKQ